MRIIDADKLKRKVQRVATEAWKMKLTASIETTLNQFIDYLEEAPTIKTKCIKYYDGDENVWKIGEVIVNSSEKPNNSTISKMEQVETMSCAECKHRPIGAEICEEPCHYEPQTDWHYDEQDATWYPYKHEDEPRTEGVWNAGYKTGYDKGFRDARKVNDSQKLVNAFCEDGTWLERQGVYTLTLAEAKQRAVDIIEAVSRKDEADIPQMELPKQIRTPYEGDITVAPQTDCGWK